MAALPRVRAEYDFQRDGVRIAIMRADSSVYVWPPATVQILDEGYDLGPENWLTIGTDEARALYEALAEHFGHTGHDIRALRKDYDDERLRVDKFINALIARGVRPA